jgi:hypothetical protein
MESAERERGRFKTASKKQRIVSFLHFYDPPSGSTLQLAIAVTFAFRQSILTLLATLHCYNLDRFWILHLLNRRTNSTE